MSGERPRQFNAVAGQIERALVEYTLPSVAVAVARKGEILWEEGFGWADREGMVRATPHTVYSLGSISKPITATALMVLAERGLVDLDRPVNDYLGDVGVTARVGDARDATVRRLANHTSGLPVHWHYFYQGEVYWPPAMEETIRRYGNLVTAPGERYHYANLGYGILGHVIARVPGKSYADFLREEVFLPLGMTRSSEWITSGLEPYAAKQYGMDNVAYPAKDSDHHGAGAICASAHDLISFGTFHLKHRLPEQRPILTEHALNEMQVATAQEDETHGYGIGWSISDDELGYRTIGHAGGSGGVRTALWMFPDEGIVIAVLTNSSRRNPVVPDRILGDIAGVLLPDLAERLAQRRAQAVDDEQRAETPPVFEPPPELIGAWRGSLHTYEGDEPLTLWFKASGDVHAHIGSALRTLVNDVAFRDGSLSGAMLGSIATPDAARRPHHLCLDLTLRGDALNGAIVAMSDANDENEGGAPGRWVGYALSHWAEVRRP